MNSSRPWFYSAAIYQIYPRSFYDSNNDGVGDLKGITDKLDYLNGQPDSLGINAIWISPIYKSPMADFGYDVSDYQDIDPIFGNLKDFRELLEAAHKRHIKVIMDFVPNHTSDQHPWFIESKSSKTNPKRDWYVWLDGQANQPPNNWMSVFGGLAWEYDKHTDQYYLHSFDRQQPDLNWDNPEVRQSMKEVMKFWLDLGVDGFRMDAVPWLSKEPNYPDDPINDSSLGDNNPYEALKHLNSRDGPFLTEYLNDLARLLKQYPDRFMIIEAYPQQGFGVDYYNKLYREIDSSVSSPFNFGAIFLPWEAKAYKSYIDKFQKSLKDTYIPAYSFGNHDVSRIASRIGIPASRTAAMLLMTLPGAPTIYNGDELGITDVVIPKDQVKDPREIIVPGQGLGRDPERTPFLWSAEKNAGFSKADPWLPVSANYKDINLAAQREDQQSFFNLYKALLAIRNSSDILKFGKYQSLDTGPDIYGFKRVLATQEITVIINFSDQSLKLPKTLKGDILLSTYLDKNSSTAILRGNEGLIIRLPIKN